MTNGISEAVSRLGIVLTKTARNDGRFELVLFERKTIISCITAEWSMLFAYKNLGLFDRTKKIGAGRRENVKK